MPTEVSKDLEVSTGTQGGVRRIAASALLALMGCAAAPEPAPVAPPAVPPVVVAPGPDAPRWILSRGPSRVGGETIAGTLVILGGRRAILAADGSVRSESAAISEPVYEVVEVPTPAGPRYFSAAPRRILRFDDP